MDMELKVGISVGKSRIAASWPYKEMSWDEFSAMCAKPIQTKESMAEYKAMSHDQQGKIKDVGGFFAGSFAGNKRKKENVQLRTMFTFDLDDIAISAEDIANKLDVGTAAVIYSTHKHTTENPRLRIVIPFTEPLAFPQMYEPAARILAKRLGFLQYCDPSTFDISRFFYWPSVSRDGDWFYRKIEGLPVSPMQVLRDINWADASTWPLCPNEREPRRLALACGGTGQDVQDPLTKDGIIGAFCRAHSPIDEAIIELLPDVYAPGKSGRMTYIKGSTSNGVILYDQRWAYSQHGTDPASRMLLNIFDLCRVHMFGHLDEGARVKTTEKLPSFDAMLEFASKDEKTLAIIDAETLTDFVDLINPDADVATTPSNSRSTTAASADRQTNWMAKIPNRKKNGEIEPTMTNILYILKNDPNLKGLIRYNVFADRMELTRQPPWGSSSDVWCDRDDAHLRAYFETMFNIVAANKIDDAITSVSFANRYHPVKDYFENLPEWDGIPRAQTLFIDYLGAEDNKLNRAITGLVLTACVRRIYQPGTKYDHCAVLYGPEGIGKSTVLSVMGGEWFTDAANPSTDPKTFTELIKGKMLVEWQEMDALDRAADTLVKSQLSRQVDRVRKAYGRRVEESRRQCVIVGTTNDPLFLRGENGTRRMLPITVTGVDCRKDFTKLAEERDQIWAEVYASHKAHPTQPLMLPRELARESIERARAFNVDEARLESLRTDLVEFLDMKLPTGWDEMSPEARARYISDPGMDVRPGISMRGEFCIKEFMTEYLRMDRKDKNYIYMSKKIGKIMESMTGWIAQPKTKRFKFYGVTKYYIRDVEYKDSKV